SRTNRIGLSSPRARYCADRLLVIPDAFTIAVGSALIHVPAEGMSQLMGNCQRRKLVQRDLKTLHQLCAADGVPFEENFFKQASPFGEGRYRRAHGVEPQLPQERLPIFRADQNPIPFTQIFRMILPQNLLQLGGFRFALRELITFAAIEMLRADGGYLEDRYLRFSAELAPAAGSHKTKQSAVQGPAGKTTNNFFHFAHLMLA